MKTEETVTTKRVLARTSTKAKALKSPAPKSVEKSTVNDTVVELGEPSPLEELEDYLQNQWNSIAPSQDVYCCQSAMDDLGGMLSSTVRPTYSMVKKMMTIDRIEGNPVDEPG